jgi:hypothetical protein
METFVRHLSYLLIYCRAGEWKWSHRTCHTFEVVVYKTYVIRKYSTYSDHNDMLCIVHIKSKDMGALCDRTVTWLLI